MVDRRTGDGRKKRKKKPKKRGRPPKERVRKPDKPRAAPTGLLRPWMLTPELKAIVGKSVAHRCRVIKFLWRYIREHKLQDQNDARFIIPDQKLGKIFGMERFRAFAMAKLVTKHLIPLPIYDRHHGHYNYQHCV